MAVCSLDPTEMSSSNSKPDYAGDIDVREAWAMLEADPKAELIDVRTVAEWNFVGLPDVASLSREVRTIEWQNFPSRGPDPEFAGKLGAALRQSGATVDTPLLFLCRSGARSRSAAIAMTQAGYSKAFNVAGGFEGDPDGKGHRGNINGWKAAGLPWRQS